MDKKAIHEITEVLAEEKDPKVIRQFLAAILTPHETAAIALRWRLVCMLQAGVSQRDIARELGVSLCKITRGSRELKHGSASFKDLVEKTVKKKGRKNG